MSVRHPPPILRNRSRIADSLPDCYSRMRVRTWIFISVFVTFMFVVVLVTMKLGLFTCCLLCKMLLIRCLYICTAISPLPHKEKTLPVLQRVQVLHEHQAFSDCQEQALEKIFCREPPRVLGLGLGFRVGV